MSTIFIIFETNMKSSDVRLLMNYIAVTNLCGQLAKPSSDSQTKSVLSKQEDKTKNKSLWSHAEIS